MVRDAVFAALAEVLYIDETDLSDGDATDLRDLGLDSVRFVVLMKKLGVNRESDEPRRFIREFTIEAWAAELEHLRDDR